MKTFHNKDFLAGALFLVFAAAALFISSSYGFGQLSQPGSGFFPTLLSSLLLGLGAIQVVKSLCLGSQATAAIKWHLRTLLCVVAAFVAFGFLIEDWGLVVALAAATFIASFAEAARNWGRTLLLMIAVPLICTIIFISLLGLGISALPETEFPWI